MPGHGGSPACLLQRLHPPSKHPICSCTLRPLKLYAYALAPYAHAPAADWNFLRFPQFQLDLRNSAERVNDAQSATIVRAVCGVDAQVGAWQGGAARPGWCGARRVAARTFLGQVAAYSLMASLTASC